MMDWSNHSWRTSVAKSRIFNLQPIRTVKREFIIATSRGFFASVANDSAFIALAQIIIFDAVAWVQYGMLVYVGLDS